MRLLSLFLAVSAFAVAQPKKILYFSQTTGFRHGSIETARAVLETLAPERFAVTSSEDPAILNAEALRGFDAVVFFTSGELPLSDAQKRDLLDYVRGGGGFMGFHSATDTFYTWPEYGELIGGYVDGHPWTQRVKIDVEDPDSPLVKHLTPAFWLTEEVYQHKLFDRANVRVLLTLDVTSVDLSAEGVNRTDEDFALAWVRNYGRGRVFYSALGHFDENFTDPRLRPMYLRGLEWITGLVDGDATPRGSAASAKPVVKTVAEAAQLGFPGLIAPSSLVTIQGENLTTGSTVGLAGAFRLAGSSVWIDGVKAPLVMASPGQINLLTPAALGEAPSVTVRAGVLDSDPVGLKRAVATPGIFGAIRANAGLLVFCGGLGSGTLSVTVNGETAAVGGIAPIIAGIYQVSVVPKAPVAAGATINIAVGDASASYTIN